MDNSILIDESLFDEEFIPERLVSREAHVKSIVSSLKSANCGRSKNLFIHGPPGVGKTLVTRWILKEHFDKNSVYINCWSNRTSHKVIRDILLKTDTIVHGKEPTSELVRMLETKQKKVICLDEFDHLEETDILYDLWKNSHALVMISNTPYSLAEIDGRIRSRLLLDEVEFKPYGNEEVYNILKERVEYGMRTGAVSEDLISIVSKMCNGDARIGLQTLRLAAREAETQNRDTITIEDVKAASKCARKYRLSYLLGKLNEHQRIIYEILKQNKSMDSGVLFNEYRKLMKENVTDRSYRNYMSRMVELELVRVISSGRWKKYEIMM